MAQMIGITPLQYSPNAMLDFSQLTRGLNDYRRGAIEARQSEELARAGRMTPEAGYQHLMGVGMPEQAMRMGLYPLQRRALEADIAGTGARTRLMGAQADESAALLGPRTSLAQAEAALKAAQQAALQRQQDMIRDLLGPGAGGSGTSFDPGRFPSLLSPSLNPLLVPRGQ